MIDTLLHTLAWTLIGIAVITAGISIGVFHRMISECNATGRYRISLFFKYPCQPCVVYRAHKKLFPKSTARRTYMGSTLLYLAAVTLLYV